MATLPPGIKTVTHDYSGKTMKLTCYPYESRPDEPIVMQLIDGVQDSSVSTLAVHRAAHDEIKRLCRAYGVEAGVCVAKVKPLDWRVYFYSSTSIVQNIGVIRFFRMHMDTHASAPYRQVPVWMRDPYYLDPKDFEQDYTVVIKDRLLAKKTMEQKT